MFSKMKTKSSILKFCRGPGILSLHQYMERRNPELKSNSLKIMKKELKQQQKKELKKGGFTKNDKTEISASAVITYSAIHGKDQLCEMTLDFLLEIIAQSLQRMALTMLPMGGIYLGGGICNVLAEYVEKK